MWLIQAKQDLISAQKNHEQGIYYAASFLAQPAAEKALKAHIIVKEKKLIKVHDLVFLAKKAKLPDSFLDSCEKLTQAYIQTKYPDLAGSLPRDKFSKQISQENIHIAEKIIEWTEKKI